MTVVTGRRLRMLLKRLLCCVTVSMRRRLGTLLKRTECAGVDEGMPVQPAVQTGLRAAVGEPSTAREQLHNEAEAAAHIGLPGVALTCFASSPSVSPGLLLCAHRLSASYLLHAMPCNLARTQLHTQVAI